VILPYIHSFVNNEVDGQQLLSLRPDDLEHRGITKVGHQEIILEAIEYLRNFVSIIKLKLKILCSNTVNFRHVQMDLKDRGTGLNP
jgi:hypothetical protein